MPKCQNCGLSFEWHDFGPDHPTGIEITHKCFNCGADLPGDATQPHAPHSAIQTPSDKPRLQFDNLQPEQPVPISGIYTCVYCGPNGMAAKVTKQAMSKMGLPCTLPVVASKKPPHRLKQGEVFTSCPNCANVQTSTQTMGDCTGWTLVTEGEAVAVPPDATFAMSIDDVFVLRGRGTVVTGCIAKGFVRVGETLSLKKLGGTEKSTVCEQVEREQNQTP
jgi:hypothetical protein